jgi:hypothetical protein
MNRLFVALTGILLLTILALARHPAGEKSRRAPNAKVQFLGTWKLVSTEEILKNGTSRPYQEVGPRGMGYLMYAADGHMCAELTNPDRPKWDDPPTTAQKIAAIEGMTAYCGRFEIDDLNPIMWHYPELASNQGYVGTKQRRPYRFEGNRLTFSGKQPPEEDQTVDRWKIVWEKVQ